MNRVIQGSFPCGVAHFASRMAAQPRMAVRQAAGSAVQLLPGVVRFPGGDGQPLPAAVRQMMEAVFRTSFADVRVHVGRDATALGATAFTAGTHIHFAPGQYDVATQRGRQTLARELAHVVQQRAGRVRNPFASGLAVVQDPLLEAEADRLARRAATASAPRPAPAVQRAVGRTIQCKPSDFRKIAQHKLFNLTPLQTMRYPDWYAYVVNVKPYFLLDDDDSRLVTAFETASTRAASLSATSWDRFTAPQQALAEEIARAFGYEARWVRSLPRMSASASALKKNINEILDKNRQIFVAKGYDIYKEENYRLLTRYTEGLLVLHRASQQWFRSFPKDAAFADVVPKGPLVPNTDPMPDFAENNTNWVPFTEDRAYAIDISLSVGALFRDYWKRNALDLAAPFAIVQSIYVRPSDPIAFGIDGEFQIKGRQRANQVLKIGVDDDLTKYGLTGASFRKMLDS